MSPTPLGQDDLRVMLAVAGRVLVVNATRAADEAEIVDVVIVRHDDNGHASQVVRALGLEHDESEPLYPSDTAVLTPKLIEVLLRTSFRGRLVETYLAVSPSTMPVRGWEAGIRGMHNPLRAGEVQITDVSGFAAYLAPYE